MTNLKTNMIARIGRYGGTALVLCLCFGGTVAVRAQTGTTSRPSGSGGFPSSSSSQFRPTGTTGGSSSSSAYPSSTMMGDVTFGYDPETKRIFFITDEET